MPIDNDGNEIMSEREMTAELYRWEKWKKYLSTDPAYEGLFSSEDGDFKLKVIRTAIFYHDLFRETGPKGEEAW